MQDLDAAATARLLADLKDGDLPLERGDHFTVPERGRMKVSRVLGWRDSLRLVKKGGSFEFEAVRVLQVTAFRAGKMRAERVNFALPTQEVRA